LSTWLQCSHLVIQWRREKTKKDHVSDAMSHKWWIVLAGTDLWTPKARNQKSQTNQTIFESEYGGRPTGVVHGTPNHACFIQGATKSVMINQTKTDKSQSPSHSFNHERLLLWSFFCVHAQGQTVRWHASFPRGRASSINPMKGESLSTAGSHECNLLGIGPYTLNLINTSTIANTSDVSVRCFSRHKHTWKSNSLSRTFLWTIVQNRGVWRSLTLLKSIINAIVVGWRSMRVVACLIAINKIMKRIEGKVTWKIWGEISKHRFHVDSYVQWFMATSGDNESPRMATPPRKFEIWNLENNV